jgi:Cu+-exporting ATPase
VTTPRPGTAPADGSAAVRQVELAITGMTCASCATRIERKLNKLDGVQASVNYATEKASVRFPAALAPEALVSTVEQAGYAATLPPAPGAPDGADGAGGAAADPLSLLRQRLLVSALLSAPVIAMAMVPLLQFDFWQWLSLTLASPVVVWGAWPFHRAAWANLRHATSTMDTLVSMGVLAAFGWSVYALFWGGAGMPGATHEFALTAQRGDGAMNIYLEVAAGVTTFLLAGRYFETRAKRNAGAALRRLLELGVKDVALLEEGRDGPVERRVPADRLAPGDRFVVRPGERIATDGVVEDGTSAVDRSLVTGESVPVEVGPGDAVVGATLNAGGRLVVRATRVGADTQLAQMARLVEEAQQGKAPAQRLADRVSAVFVPLVIVLAVGTLGFWLGTGAGPGAAFSAAVAVLIIACPCALGLATPTALLVGTGRGAQLGILIRGPEVLETTRHVDTVVLDKTGTVTTGRMGLVSLSAAPGESEEMVLRLAGAVEAASEHPVGRAVAAAARARLGPLPPVHGFASREGLGAQGTVTLEADDAREVLVGRPALFAGWPDPAQPLAEELERAWRSGYSAFAVGWSGTVRGVVVVADAVRPGAADAVRRLRELGLRPMLLTGDHEAVARTVAAQVGIGGDGQDDGPGDGPDDGPEDVVAEVLPADKVRVVRALQERGHVVAMVGDGVNDAAALAQADLGLAVGTGSDVAIEASDLTLVGGDLRLTADAIRLSRRTLATIKGNLFWAFAYNVVALPVAAAGLLNPMLAGAAMALSSVFVVSNSLRLRRFQPR